MDSERFDTLAKTLAQPGTRRGVVRRLAALSLGATLAALGGHALTPRPATTTTAAPTAASGWDTHTRVRDETRADACVMQGVA